MERLKRKNTQSGITLIALVITIIVLLILAGVSLSLVVGENGILNKATSAAEDTKEGVAIEQVSLAWSACQTDYLTDGKSSEGSSYFTKEKLNANLSQGEVIEVNFEKDANKTSEVLYKINNEVYKVVIPENGDVSIAGNTPVTPTQPVTLISRIKENPAEYYGKKVSGYTANGISDWRIFYADNDNVFLITTDYLSAEKAVASNSTMIANGAYSILWSTAPSEVPSTTNVDKFSPITSETMKWTGNYGTNENGRCVSTLLDTSKWTGFLDKVDGTGKGQMAIGSPTLNMWIASWNTKYPSDKLFCNNSTELGYYIGNNNNPEGNAIENSIMSAKEGYIVSEENNMYYPNKSAVDNDRCKGYWLSSPMAAHRWAAGYVNCNSSPGFSTHSGDFLAIRPVVCLNSNVKTISIETDSIIVLVD